MNIHSQIFQVNSYLKSDTDGTNTSTYAAGITSVFHNIKILCYKYFLDFGFKNMAKGFISIQVLNYSQEVNSRKQAICQ